MVLIRGWAGKAEMGMIEGICMSGHCVHPSLICLAGMTRLCGQNSQAFILALGP